ncbi:hypothetical protein HPB49_009350 [Dermacentor silvarum]|uniref:Uncharacterized protein n=1 Tax=Dermacentor silvarum TaxID=543639 RepID=A0ACB8DYR3_DERSI|nr:uncharacterized protein LOC119463756 [Dermacentor silvarum]KAH7979406.1 hypothetical protein HPB49_009350 [Dermacentor silvarum]
MAPLSNTVFRIFGALLVVFILKHSADAKKVLNINDKVKDFVQKLGRQHNTKVVWWDMHGKPEKLLSKGDDYKKYQVSAKADPMRYGPRSNGTEKPDTVYVATFRNEQPSQSQKVIIERKTRRERHASWQSTKSIHLDVNVRTSLSLSGIFNFRAGVDYSYDLTSGESHVEKEVVEFSIKKEITIPPRTKVEVEWVITESVERYPWKSDVLLDGWFALWFEKRVHNHHLWFYPIDVIKDPDLKLHEPSGVVYTTEGIAEGVNLIRNELRVRQHDLVPETSASANTTTYRLKGGDVVSRTVNEPSVVGVKAWL